MKAHVVKPTAGIKMPQYKVSKPAPTPKAAKTPHAAKPNVKSTPTIKLPTISQHREKLADLAPQPGAKKGKTS
jgi:hypothetical protein